MTTVEFIYNGNTIKRNLPQSWEEISARQLLAYARLSDDSSFTAHDLAIEFLNPDRDILFRLNRAQLDAVTRQLEWLWTTPINLPAFLIPEFSHKCITYYSPGNNLQHTTVEEMAMADNYLRMYAQRKDEHYLNCMVATLYRHTTPYRYIAHQLHKDDIRCGLHSKTIDRSAKRIASVPLYIRKAILYSLIGYNNYTRQVYPYLYRENDKKSMGWASTIINLAGPELGTIEQVGTMLWNNALVFMAHLELTRKPPATNPVEQQQNHSQ